MTFTTISASPQGNFLKGIIHYIKNGLGINDPIASNIVIPSAMGSALGDQKTLVLWDSDCFLATTNANSWVQLSFPGRYIFPSAYSLRGVTGVWCYPLEWNVYGIKDGEENKTSDDWDLIGSSKTSESTYCLTNSVTCNDTTVGTFKLKRMHSLIGYRHLRWMITKGSCSDIPRFATSGIDVYGTLSVLNINLKDAKNIQRICEVHLMNHLISAAAGNAVIQK